MPRKSSISRRKFLQSTAVASAALALPRSRAFGFNSDPPKSSGDNSALLQEFAYSEVSLDSPPHEQQLRQTHEVLMNLSEDSLLKPFRQMIGKPAPGEDLGGWYRYDPDYDWHTFDAGFAPTATFGQWVSALARYYAITGDQATREKVLRLNRLYAQVIDGEFYGLKNRFPAYCYDKLVCGLIDSHKYAGDPDAFAILEKTTDTALPHLPGHAIEHGKSWRPGTDESYTWDESYTMPENLFLAYQRGAGERYREMGQQYLHDLVLDRLAEGQNDLAGRHAYSHVNMLSSAMQAYLTLGSESILRAAKNGFDICRAELRHRRLGPRRDAPQDRQSRRLHQPQQHPQQLRDSLRLLRALQADALSAARDARSALRRQHGARDVQHNARRAPLESDGRTSTTRTATFRAEGLFQPSLAVLLGHTAAGRRRLRINTYLRDVRGVYVNLYIPSTVKWTQDGAHEFSDAERRVSARLARTV